MTQKGFAPLLIILVLGVLAACTGGLFYLNSQKLKADQTIPPDSIRPTPLLSPSPQVDETSKWKTFSHTDSGITWQIQYPEDETVTLGMELYGRVNNSSVPSIDFISSNFKFNLLIVPSSSETAQGWLNTLIQEEKDNCTVDCSGFSGPTQPLTINGKDALTQNTGSGVPTFNLYIPLTKNNLIWASTNSIGTDSSDGSVPQVSKDMLIKIMSTLKIQS